jgi:lipopolysaccharide export LptBFGC system permease protein LptF
MGKIAIILLLITGLMYLTWLPEYNENQQKDVLLQQKNDSIKLILSQNDSFESSNDTLNQVLNSIKINGTKSEKFNVLIFEKLKRIEPQIRSLQKNHANEAADLVMMDAVTRAYIEVYGTDNLE